VALLDDFKHLIRIALPLVELGEDLDLVKPGVARALDPGADVRQVDDAVAIMPRSFSRSRVGTRTQPVGRPSLFIPLCE
jgi:hypothetical protein